MEKKFERKTRKRLYDSHWQAKYPEGVLLDYAEAANAEIDRLNDELAALRSQPAAERVWISSETHPTFPKPGVWFYTGNGFRGAVVAGCASVLEHGKRYTCILDMEDFPDLPPEPEPIEVKVGKYRWPDGSIAIIHAIDEYGNAAYQGGKWKNQLRITKVNDVRALFTNENAVFIGGGDDAE